MKLNVSHPLFLPTWTARSWQTCGRSQGLRSAESPSDSPPTMSRERHMVDDSPFPGKTLRHDVFETSVMCSEHNKGKNISRSNPRRAPNPPCVAVHCRPPSNRGAHCCRRETLAVWILLRAGQGELSVHGVAQHARFRQDPPTAQRVPWLSRPH